MNPLLNALYGGLVPRWPVYLTMPFRRPNFRPKQNPPSIVIMNAAVTLLSAEQMNICYEWNYAIPRSEHQCNERINRSNVINPGSAPDQRHGLSTICCGSRRSLDQSCQRSLSNTHVQRAITLLFFTCPTAGGSGDPIGDGAKNGGFTAPWPTVLRHWRPFWPGRRLGIHSGRGMR